MNRSFRDIFFPAVSRLACAILFLCIFTEAHSQTYNSRDNHAGISSYASSWQGQAPVVTSETLFNNAGLVVWGYLSHGTDWSRANATFTGANAKVVVEDTLRIHGGLTMKSGSSIHIKPGGILIVQADYYQDADVVFRNEGKAIFLGAWQTVDNPSATTNTGTMYVAGPITAVGTSITIKPYSALQPDSPSLYEFSRNNIIKAEECAGSNSGSVSFSESGATVIRWEMSTDFFKTKTDIANTSTTQPYSNLTKTTSFRAYYRTSSGVGKYSPGSTYVVLGQAKGGTLSGPAEVCAGTNSGTLSLQNYLGEIVQWESSTNNFSTVASTSVSISSSFSFSNLSQTTYYRVRVKNGSCSQVYSGIFTVTVTQPSQGGSLSGSKQVCKGSNSGTISLTGHTGNVIRWESSTTSNFSSITAISNTAASYSYTNLSATTYFRAVVKNGPCTQAYSTTGVIEVKDIVGGSITGSQTIGTTQSSSTLSLSGHIGNILRWESSTDNFQTVSTIAHTGTQYVAPATTLTTNYRVVVSNGGTCPNITSSSFELLGDPSLGGSALAGWQPELPTDGLVESFPFSGSAKNATGNGNNGVVVGATPASDRFNMANNAYRFDGVDDFIYTILPISAPGPQVFTISIWFQTSSTDGGSLIGFGDNPSGPSTNHDRHVYLDKHGRLYFGVNPMSHRIIRTSESYNDGKWHHAVASLSSEGMKLFVDGVLKVSDINAKEAKDFEGHWKIGHDPVISWPGEKSRDNFEGSLDDINIYNRPLSNEEINLLYKAGAEPVCEGGKINLYAASGTEATYSWSGPNGFSSSAQNPTLTNITNNHAGTYSVEINIKGHILKGSTEVKVTPPVQAGSVTASQTTYCSGTNSGTLKLEGFVGSIIRWERSTDNFKSNVQIVAHTTAELSFVNLTTTISYRAVVKSGNCGVEKGSGSVTINIDAPSQGGSLSGSKEVCEGSNSGIINLTGHTGSIIRWESAANDQFSTVTTINSSSTSYSYENLAATTYFRAVVKNGLCSEAYSTTATIEVKEIAGGTLSGTRTVCEGNNSGSISLSGYTGSIIRWESSTDGFETAQVISHTADQLAYENLVKTTSYRAIIGNGGKCPEVSSSTVQIKVDKKVEGGRVIASQTKVCSGVNDGTLTLLEYSGEVIRWESSTNNFESITSIVNTTASHTFQNLNATTSYRAVVKSGTCGEKPSAAVTIAVDEPSVGGTISRENPQLCAGVNQGVLTLSGYRGEIIRWESASDAAFNSLKIINATTSEISFNNLSVTTYFRAVVKNGSCSELYSTSVSIKVSEVKGGAVAGSLEVCSGINSGSLTLRDYSGNIIRWESSTDGFIKDVKSISNTTADLRYQNLTVSTSYRAVTGNEICPAVYSVPADITVNLPSKGGELLSDKNSVCSGNNSGTLYLQNHLGQVQRWERSSDGFENHVEEIAHTLSEFSFSSLSATTSFRAVVKSGQCSEVSSIPFTVTVEAPPVGGVLNGGKRVKPAENEGELELQGYEGTILYWESSADQFARDIKKIASTSPILTYKNLLADTWFRAVLQKNSCEAVYSDLALISVNKAPVAVADTFRVEPDKTFYGEISLMANDYDPDRDQIILQAGQNLRTAAGNELHINASGTLVFTPQPGFAGTDHYQYQICDDAAEASVCSYGWLVFHVQKGELVVYQGLSPNQDQKNDHWFIENIEHYPNNLIQVYNPDGILVFEMQGYNNSEKVFSGIGNRGIGSSGRELAEGTYYYYIRLGEAPSGVAPSGVAQPDLKGYIILNR